MMQFIKVRYSTFVTVEVNNHAGPWDMDNIYNSEELIIRETM